MFAQICVSSFQQIAIALSTSFMWSEVMTDFLSGEVQEVSNNVSVFGTESNQALHQSETGHSNNVQKELV